MKAEKNESKITHEISCAYLKKIVTIKVTKILICAILTKFSKWN